MGREIEDLKELILTKFEAVSNQLIAFNEDIHCLLDKYEENRVRVENLEKHNVEYPVNKLEVRVEKIEKETEITRFFSKSKFLTFCVIVGVIVIIGFQIVVIFFKGHIIK